MLYMFHKLKLQIKGNFEELSNHAVQKATFNFIWIIYCLTVVNYNTYM